MTKILRLTAAEVEEAVLAYANQRESFEPADASVIPLEEDGAELGYVPEFEIRITPDEPVEATVGG